MPALAGASSSTSESLTVSNLATFFCRPEIYTGITLTPAMLDIAIGIMVEVLTIPATATKEVKCGRSCELTSNRFTIFDSSLVQKSISRS